MEELQRSQNGRGSQRLTGHLSYLKYHGVNTPVIAHRDQLILGQQYQDVWITGRVSAPALIAAAEGSAY